MIHIAVANQVHINSRNLVLERKPWFVYYMYLNKQLFHGGLVNSQNYCPEVTRMTMIDYCPRPKSEGNSPPWSSEAPRGNGFDYSPNSHEITVLLPNNNI